jgi:hypothetical protein
MSLSPEAKLSASVDRADVKKSFYMMYVQKMIIEFVIEKKPVIKFYRVGLENAVIRRGNEV